MSIHTIDVSEPWFSLIESGTKKVEGRKGTAKWIKINPGDVIRFTSPNKTPFFRVVKDVRYYDDDDVDPLTDYLINEGIRNCLPGVTRLDEAREIYLGFWSMDEIIEYGMLAIEV
jgi:ASC-1-like (ASCH) protein